MRKNFLTSFAVSSRVFREHKDIRKSRLPWKQRNSVDKPKMTRASDESKMIEEMR